MEIIMCDSSRLACERHRERKCVAEGCGVDGGISGGVQEGMNVAQEHLRAQLRRSWRKEKNKTATDKQVGQTDTRVYKVFM